METDAEFVAAQAFPWCLPPLLPPIFPPRCPPFPFIFLPFAQSLLAESSVPTAAEQSETTNKHSRGRKVRPDTILLNKFRNTNKAARAPKKEYLRIRVIRGLKRAIRQVLDKQRSFTSMNSVEKDNPVAMYHWNLFKTAVKRNQNALQALAQPKLDTLEAKSPPKYEEFQDSYSCYNNAFCRDFLSNAAVQAVFGFYLNVLFADMQEEVLTSKFGFEAMADSALQRSWDWENLRQFLYKGMLEDLRIKSAYEREKLEDYETALG